MFKGVLLIALRSYFRNRISVLINILALGLAISCCIGGFFNWKFKHDWDKSHVNGERIYRIQFRSVEVGDTVEYGVAPAALAKEIDMSIGGVRNVVRYFPSAEKIKIGQNIFKSNFAYVDSAFFDLFTFPILRGTASDLRDKNKIFISEEAAKRYFNTIEVVGRRIFLASDASITSFSVAGVFATQPLNSSFSIDAITLYSNLKEVSPDVPDKLSGWERWNTVFLEIDNSTLTPYVEKQLKRFVSIQNKVRHGPMVSSFYLQKFNEMANKSAVRPGVRWQQLRYGIPDEAVLVPNVTAFLLLLLACFNFTNTSISIAGTRVREIGVRKVLGAGKRQIRLQFFIENLGLCAVALLVGLAFAELIVPAYNSLWPFLKLEIRYFGDLYFLAFLTLLLVLSALISGSYPALYIASFEPLAILKGKAGLRANGWFSRLLLGSIFMLSVLGIVFAVAFYGNSKFQADYDLGYSTTGVLSISLDKPGDFAVFKNAMTGRVGVEKIAGTKDHVSKDVHAQNARYGDIEKLVEEIAVGEDYLEALGMKIKEGRGFATGSHTDQVGSILVTEEFVRQFGWRDSAVGKRVVLGDSFGPLIIGVLGDIYPHSVFEAVKPLVVRFAPPDAYKYAILRGNPSAMSRVEKSAKEQWQKSFPGKLFDIESIDVVRESTNRVNLNGVKIVGLLAVFSLLISLAGLYTMATLNIARRTKEIGIRRILGASRGNIIKIVNYDFFYLLTIAGVAGGSAGYFLVDMVMKTMWQYYLSISIVTVAVCLTSLLAIGFGVLISKALVASSNNPVNSIKTS